MKRTRLTLLAGLGLCLIAAFMAAYNASNDGRDGVTSSAPSGESASSSNGDGKGDGVPNGRVRKLKARENIDRLLELGYAFTADQVDAHKAKGNVKIITPEGAVLRGDSVSISSDGENIFLSGGIRVEPSSGDSSTYMEFKDDGAFAKISLTGGELSFEGKGVMRVNSHKQE